MKRILTCGTFDCFHYGHLNFLKKAKEMGDYLIVLIPTDEFDIVRGKTEKRDNLRTRIKNVVNSGYVDEIIIEPDENKKLEIVIKRNIDIFCSSEEWNGKYDYLKEYCEVVYLPRTKGISSTMIRWKNKNAD